MLLLLAACWSPDPSLAPALPPLEDAALTGVYEPSEDDGALVADAPPGEPGVGEGDDDERADDEADPGDDDGSDDLPPFDAYTGYTTAAPVSIVDDYGKPLAIVQKLGTEVEVRGEDDLRRRVWCASCRPATEGWVQRIVVTDRGARPPTTATVLPPGAPRPGMPLGG